jgi:hypothetical protein
LLVLLVLAGSGFAPTARADNGGETADKTLSPYFFVEGGDPALDG